MKTNGNLANLSKFRVICRANSILFFIVSLNILLLTMVSLNSVAQTSSSSQSSANSSEAMASANASSLSANNEAAQSSSPTSKISKDNELLAQELKAFAKEDEIEWIETTEEKIVALYKEPETKVAKGVLWILHAPDSPPAWPANLEILRRNIPIYGWGSFALPLPAKNIFTADQSNSSSTASETNASSSAATTSVEASSAASSENSSIPKNVNTQSSTSSELSNEKELAQKRGDIINARIESAYAKLQEKGLLNVVALVDNSSAHFVLANLAEKSAPNSRIKGLAQAVILVNLQSQEPLTKEELKSIFSNPDLPVMDVFFEPDNRIQQEQKRNHRAEAMRQKLKDYQQVSLPAEDFVNIDNQQSFWLHIVLGYMDKKAKSEEAKRVQRN